MNTVLIVNCCKEKLKSEAKASDLYISERFKISKKIALNNNFEWYILSSKYGILNPQEIINPYNISISDLSVQEKQLFITKVIDQIKNLNLQNKRLVFLCDPDYTTEIIRKLNENHFNIISPFSYLKKQEWIAYLRQIDNSDRLALINDLYNLIDYYFNQTGGLCTFKEIKSLESIPDKGLYIFFSKDECRLFYPEQHRIIRIGTHAVSNGSKSTLWQRLKAHKGKENLEGNHRSSIFRLHVGNAIMNKKGISCDTWGKNLKLNTEEKINEDIIEREVTNYISETYILLINIDDTVSKYSDRAYLEQNLIALISGNYLPIDFQNEDWLGNYSSNEFVKRSSLWNVDYTNKGYDKDFLNILRIHIEISLGKMQNEHKSYAPHDWYLNSRENYLHNSINFK